MLQYNKIDISEGIDSNKTKDSSRCIIFNYYYFLKVNFRFQPNTCDSRNAKDYELL